MSFSVGEEEEDFRNRNSTLTWLQWTSNWSGAIDGRTWQLLILATRRRPHRFLPKKTRIRKKEGSREQDSQTANWLNWQGYDCEPKIQRLQSMVAMETPEEHEAAVHSQKRIHAEYNYVNFPTIIRWIVIILKVCHLLCNKVEIQICYLDWRTLGAGFKLAR